MSENKKKKTTDTTETTDNLKVEDTKETVEAPKTVQSAKTKETTEAIDNSAMSTEKIANFLTKMKFRTTLFGGVSKADVWLKIKKLDNMYAQLYSEQKIKYEALIAERDDQLIRASKSYRKLMSKLYDSGDKNEEDKKQD